MAASTAAGSSGAAVARGGSATWTGDAAVEDDRRHVGHVRRLVEDRPRRRGRRGPPWRPRRASDAPTVMSDLAVRVVAHAVQPLQVLGQRPPQLERAVVAGVVGPPGPQRPHAGLDDLGRRGEVGLARRPRLMTSGIVAMTSKNLRMPDGGTGGHAPGQARGGPDGGLDGHDRPSIRAGRPLIVPGPGRRAARRRVGVAGSSSAARSAGSRARHGASAVMAS